MRAGARRVGCTASLHPAVRFHCAPSPVTFRKTLAMHYNGTTWSTPATPSPGTRNNTVTSVDGVSGTDVWAVGYSLNLPYGNRFR